MPKGKTVGIISIKGGVGKTTTVSNLAASLANDFGKKVLVIDANFSAPNIGFYLGLKEPKFTIQDILSDKVPASEAIYKHELGFHVIPSTIMQSKINPFDLKKKIAHLKEYYDIILLDSSPNLNDEILATMVASDELYAVTSPDMPTLACTMHAVKMAKQKNSKIKGIILNKGRNKRFEIKIGDVENATGVPVLALLPDDVMVLESLSKTTPTTAYSPKREVAVEYKKLAGCIAGQEFVDNRMRAKVKSLFRMDMGKQEVNRAAFLKDLQGAVEVPIADVDNDIKKK